MSALRFGVIGAGYMGKAYSIALSEVSTVFELETEAVREMIATSSSEGAADHAARFGYNRSTGDWRALVHDPDVDVVAIATPTHLHKEMALAALQAGKHVLCEKPLAANAQTAAEMAAAARRAGSVNMVGFNYARTPATQLARQMIASGEIGDVVRFSGTHNEDFLMDPNLPHDWRLEASKAGRAGALGDVASHVINLAHYLCGPIAEVVGDSQIVYSPRPHSGGARAVENDDQASFLLRFESGVMGMIEASRVQAGRKMGLTYEIVGTRGAIAFDQERMSELKFYNAADPAGRRGYRTLLSEPGHGDFGRFCVGAGHGIGYNDTVVSEMAQLIQAITAGQPAWPDFDAAVHTAAIVDAVLASVDERRWVSISEIMRSVAL